MSKYISPTRLEEITADIKKYIDAKFDQLQKLLADKENKPVVGTAEQINAISPKNPDTTYMIIDD